MTKGREVREVLAPLWDEMRGRPLDDESRSSLVLDGFMSHEPRGRAGKQIAVWKTGKVF